MEKKKMDNGTKICIMVMVCAIIGFLVAYFITNSQNYNYTTSSTNTTENKNPYTVSNQYDGTYYFKLESTYYSWAVGIITFNNGNCEVKYTKPSKYSVIDDEYKFKGFCGLNSNDENSFYFNLNDELYVYKCEYTENGFNCTLKSTYDLTGNSNKDLSLKLLSDSENKDTFYTKFVNDEKTNWKTQVEQKEAEEKARKEAEEKAKKEAEEKAKAEEEQNFKASCQTYTFEQMARNPDNFKGTNVKLTGEVIQALYGTNSVDLRVNITKKGSYSTYYTDTVYVTYNTKAGEDKILEKDIITLYGTSLGDYTYKSTIGATVNLPLISAKYITINN